MSVRVSPISRTAAILIMAIGAFVLLAGLVAGEPVSIVAGAAFITLGVVLYSLLFRFTKKLKQEIGSKSQSPGA